MLLRLLVAFIVVPLVELYLLLQLAELTSAMTTFLVVIVTGVIGSYLARREGAMAGHRFRTALAEGRAPSREIQDGLMIVFAAALLLIPLVGNVVSEEVQWDVMDFLIAYILLYGLGLVVHLVWNRLRLHKFRYLTIAAIILLFLLLWAELAVGVFGTPLAGD